MELRDEDNEPELCERCEQPPADGDSLSYEACPYALAMSMRPEEVPKFWYCHECLANAVQSI